MTAVDGQPWELCLIGLGIAGEPATAADVCFQLDGDLDDQQVRAGLHRLTRRRLVRVAGRRQGRGRPENLYGFTPAGRGWLDAWAGPDEDGRGYFDETPQSPEQPERVPCGLGWPP